MTATDRFSVSAATLGEASAEPPGRPEEIRMLYLSREEQRVYVAVERFRHQHRGEGRKAMTAKMACERLGESLEVYLEAKRKAVATNAEAFAPPPDVDLIRPKRPKEGA